MNTKIDYTPLERAGKIYFIGIGGISMSGLAVFALAHGCAVAGSDRGENEQTAALAERGITVYKGHKAENILAFSPDAVVYTAAVDAENPELAAALSHGVSVYSRAEFLGFIMLKYGERIGVSGTHGKSTTSAMLTEIFVHAGLDPTASLGAELRSLGGAYRLGGRSHFIYEACEYKDSFLSFSPDTAVILNIDRDHVDYFHSMEQTEDSFRRSIRTAGTVVACGEDERAMRVIADFGGRRITFGGDSSFDIHPEGVKTERGCAEFDIYAFGELYCSVRLQVPGRHNMLNALAAAGAAYASGVDGTAVGEALGAFRGAHRRFEKKGCVNGIDVYDDYAHHPSEIRATLGAVKDLGYGRVFTVFQPHTFSRTKELFDEFSTGFRDTDEVIFADIYPARETDTLGMSSALLAAATENGRYVGGFDKIKEYLCENARPGDLVLTMGAGDVWKVGELFLGTEK